MHIKPGVTIGRRKNNQGILLALFKDIFPEFGRLSDVLFPICDVARYVVLFSGYVVFGTPGGAFSTRLESLGAQPDRGCHYTFMHLVFRLQFSILMKAFIMCTFVLFAGENIYLFTFILFQRIL